MKTDMQPTLQTIADLTGLSRSTVSRALRNDPMQSRDTCKHVQKVAQEIGYRPSPMVSALMSQLKRTRKTQTTGTIGMIDLFPEKNGWKKWKSLPPFVQGCRERAEGFNYKLDYFWLGQPDLTPKRLNTILRTRGIIALIVLPQFEMNARMDMDISRFACATMGYSVKSPQMHRAARDYTKDITIAINKLTDLGYNRIGLAIPSHIEHLNECHWSAGLLTYQQGIPKKNQIPILLSSFFHSDEGLKAAYSEFRIWFEKYKPDVVLSYHEFVPKFLRRMKVSIPKEVGYVDLIHMHPDDEMAGVYLDGKHVGAATVDLVIDQINRNEQGEPDYAKLTLVHGVWQDGNTVEPQ